MAPKIDYTTVAPDAVRPLYEAAKTLAQSSLEPNLRMLVELRASQINGCAFCLALHSREAKVLGEEGDRITRLPAWREASWYTPRERAALEWTEALTLVAEKHPPKDLLARVREHFSDEELVYLTLAVATINSWNRFSIGFGVPPEAAGAVFEHLHSQHAHT